MPSSKHGDSVIEFKHRGLIAAAALLALFLGALDALIMSAAMPTIVADLGGMHLYAWVYSAYFLSRAVSLPIFGKLADLYPTRTLFLVSIGIFLLSSIAAGAAPHMGFLVVARVFQGIGAGGNFALVYIVLTDVAPPGKRAQTLSLASFIWGIASISGPTLGGFLVSFCSWRWIFFLNIPLGLLSLGGIGFFLVEMREKRSIVNLDFAGVMTLSGFILGLLTIFMVGGHEVDWRSAEVVLLASGTAVLGIAFYFLEKRAKDPILDLAFFRHRSFTFGNGAVFFSSFAIFPLFAYAPLFIQGALGKTPVQVGGAMLSLSLGWSIGSLLIGHSLQRLDPKNAAIIGSLLMLSGCAATLSFTADTTITMCFVVFQIVGIGMGFVALPTLIAVQNSLRQEDLGVATSVHQLSRTLGGTVGIGVCGGMVMNRLTDTLGKMLGDSRSGMQVPNLQNMESIFHPDMSAQLPSDYRPLLQAAVAENTSIIFWFILMAASLCCLCALLLPGKQKTNAQPRQMTR